MKSLLFTSLHDTSSLRYTVIRQFLPVLMRKTARFSLVFALCELSDEKDTHRRYYTPTLVAMAACIACMQMKISM